MGVDNCRSEFADATSAVARPNVDADRCVHSLCAAASCRACVEACPFAAWVLDDSALGFDSSVCDGCGVCRPACPEGAITFSAGSLQPLVGSTVAGAARGALALIACERADVAAGRGVVACLHALGDREVSGLAEQGCDTLLVARVDCADCARLPPRTLQSAVERVNVIRNSRSLPVLRYEEVGTLDWQARRSRLAAPRIDVDQGRRWFIGLGMARSIPESAPEKPSDLRRDDETYRHVPEIDIAGCTGCDACVHVCPHAVIGLARDVDGRLGYTLSASACTGCRLCIDVCAPHAMALREMAPLRVARVRLDEARCHRCGVRFHRPTHAALGAQLGDGSERARDDAICFICRGKDHTRSLFQVRGR